MSHTDTVEGSQHYSSTFRRHVLDPVTTAENVVERERREVEREREAFDAFATRLADIPTVSGIDSPSPERPALLTVSTDSDDDLRAAYEETVMDVSHYDTVYGESIEESLRAEYGPEFASLFDPSSSVPFADYHRESLVRATRARIDERSRFERLLDDERASLRTARRTMESTFENLDSTIVTAWYREEFDARLDELLEDRQSHIQDNPRLSRFDGHCFHEYLYADEPWTYPVLVAVGRLLDSVVVKS